MTFSYHMRVRSEDGIMSLIRRVVNEVVRLHDIVLLAFYTILIELIL